MARWQPDARDRLFAAAVDLYAEVGFDAATVADIAARAGLTERTFFRHFTDKREVLFAGGEELVSAMTTAVFSAPTDARPLEAVLAGLDAVGATLAPRRPFARERARLIADHPGLRERELIKLADMTLALAAALRSRGVPEPTASLAAEVGMAAFRVGFDQWIYGDQELGALMRAALADLAATTR